MIIWSKWKQLKICSSSRFPLWHCVVWVCHVNLQFHRYRKKQQLHIVLLVGCQWGKRERAYKRYKWVQYDLEWVILTRPWGASSHLIAQLWDGIAGYAGGDAYNTEWINHWKLPGLKAIVNLKAHAQPRVEKYTAIHFVLKSWIGNLICMCVSVCRCVWKDRIAIGHTPSLRVERAEVDKCDVLHIL